MFKAVLDLLAHKQLTFEDGSIKLLEQNVVMFPFENLYRIQKIIEKSNRINELYLSAKELGNNWIESLFRVYKMDTIEEQANWGEKVFSLAGMGKMRVVKWNVKDSTMVYRSFDSVIAKYYGKVGHAVCHIPRGWFAGASCVFFKKDVDAVEVDCLARGNKFCEFVVKPKCKFDFNNSLVRKQLRE